MEMQLKYSADPRGPACCCRERMNRLQNVDTKPAAGADEATMAASKMSIAALQQRMQTLRGSMQ